jgi:hypothetical protein
MTNRRVFPIVLVAILAVSMALQSCHVDRRPTSKSNPDSAKTGEGHPTTPPDAAHGDDMQTPEDRTLVVVSKAIRTTHLTTLSDKCIAYRFDQNSSGDAYIVDVLENHRHPECGGDPQTEPRLFTVRVDKHTQKMWTDQGLLGNFRPIE